MIYQIRPATVCFLSLMSAIFTISDIGQNVMAEDKAADRFFELRTYTTHPGRLDALHKRFRDHTNGIFKKHGMQLVAFWTPT
ncbi:MAG: NIPSNAP family protein, partial [Pirellulales bacterium]